MIKESYQIIFVVLVNIMSQLTFPTQKLQFILLLKRVYIIGLYQMFHCYTTTHVNLTSRYFAVPGQGFPPRALLLTAILHLAFPSHLPLTTASDCVDMHGGFVFRSESGQTALPSVLPQRAFSILITPAGQRSSILPSRHTMTVSITKKRKRTQP